jgi:large subunit ribosomal protein L20
MTRVKRGTTTRKRHNRLLKATKGFKGLNSRNIKWAKNAKAKAGQNSYVGRKQRKRDLRALWITRMNAACRANGLNYSLLTHGLLKAKVKVDRKILADLAVNNPDIFKQYVEIAKQELANK